MLLIVSYFYVHIVEYQIVAWQGDNGFRRGCQSLFGNIFDMGAVLGQSLPLPTTRFCPTKKKTHLPLFA
jgi:hypothetical protein